LAGTYESTACTSTTNRVCSACTVGSYCLGGSSVPIQCTAGNYCPSGSSTQTPCVTCATGEYETTACTPTTNRMCTACSNPTTSQYVTAACASTRDTQFGNKPTCTSLQYLSGFSNGSYSSVGSAGTCTACSTPTGMQYTTAACTASKDTQIATQTCSSSQYASGFSRGAYNTVGSAGTCTTCTNPTGMQYTTAACNATTDTQIATQTCSSSQYAAGFSRGAYNTVGSAGTCTACSNPTGMQIVSLVCSSTTDTVIIPSQSCSGWLDGFRSGSYNSTGYGGTCYTCSQPSASQYVTAVCTANTNTAISDAKACSAGQYLSGFSTGSSTQVGSSGTCAACPAGSTCTGGIYSSSSCPTGNYCTNGYARTCSKCSSKLSMTGSYASKACTASNDTECSYCPSGYYCPGDENKYTCSTAASCPTGVAVQCTSNADRICNSACSCSSSGYVPYQSPAASGFGLVCCPSGTTSWGYGAYSCYKNQTYYQAFTCNNNLAITGGY
jgi:hypothetical protein